MLAACEVGAKEKNNKKTATREIEALITVALDIYL
jgi:hypothetical protein